MKFSISLPEAMAHEIRNLSKSSERPISWWMQQAWNVARSKLLQMGLKEKKRRNQAMKMLHSLRGSLKGEFKHVDSVSLSKQAFRLK